MPGGRRRKTPPGTENRGGPRVGQQGKAYPNRSDLNAQPVRTTASKEYGQRAAQEASMAQQPLPQQRPFVGPDDVPTFGAPTQRPDEPLTAGLPFGPGRNPSPLDRHPEPGAVGVADQIRALYLAYPTPELREILEDLDLGD